MKTQDELPQIGQPTLCRFIAFSENLAEFGEASKRLVINPNEQTRTEYHDNRHACLNKYNQILTALQRLRTENTGIKMSTKTIRYAIGKDAKYLWSDDNTKEDINHSEGTIFVDLLEPTTEGNCDHIRVKCFFPNGNVKIGKVIGYSVFIYNKDELFDGRFNQS